MAKGILVSRLNNGVLMPAVGLGCWQLANDASTTHVVSAALRMGYRLIDGAEVYNNQGVVGPAVCQFEAPSESSTEVDMTGINRFELVDEKTLQANFNTPFECKDKRACFVTGKVFPKAFTPDAVRATVDKYLSEIRRTSADLILLHWPGHTTAWASQAEVDDPKVPELRLQAWRTLEEMVAEKKIRAIGVSNFMAKHLEHLITDVHRRRAGGCKLATIPAVNQIELSPFVPPAQDLIDVCAKYDIHITSYSTLGSTQALVRDHPEVKKVAQALGRSPTQVVLRWALQRGYQVIPRTSKEVHAAENFAINQFSLTEDDMKVVDNLKTKENNLRGCPDPNLIP